MVCLVLLLAQSATAGVILNTLQGYSEQEAGWSGRLDGLFAGSGGNTDRISLEAGGRVQYLGERHRWRLQLNGGYQESDGVETARNIVAHLRHNQTLTGRWSLVSFVQIQHNPFQRLRSRWLLGTGPRLDLVRDDKGVIGLGAVPMLESERLENEEGHLARGRLSVFLHLARSLSASTRLDAVVFWQPLFSDLSAARTVGNLTVAVNVTGAVELKVGAAVEDNARPPSGVERTDWSTFTGLGVVF